MSLLDIDNNIKDNSDIIASSIVKEDSFKDALNLIEHDYPYIQKHKLPNLKSGVYAIIYDYPSQISIYHPNFTLEIGYGIPVTSSYFKIEKYPPRSLSSDLKYLEFGFMHIMYIKKLDEKLLNKIMNNI